MIRTLIKMLEDAEIVAERDEQNRIFKQIISLLAWKMGDNRIIKEYGFDPGTRINAKDVYVARNETLADHIDVLWEAINEKVDKDDTVSIHILQEECCD